ncbi:tellurite resistance TerB C-terminal domain-containing protein, partial [Acinetobacter baumannii]|uniref:tellurite resistance TerB C-terminal domain-containing protein n=1 Tax=Acinetobacter baumannii TaxID=470 RepID=UPI0032197B00
LQLDRQRLYKDLHTFTANENFKPVMGVSQTYTKDTKFKLNAERIESLQKETALVSTLLANVFVEEETQPNNENVIEPEHEKPSETNPTLFGLDIEHSAFLRRLITRPQWSREELLNLAADFDLMLDGALENINESTLDHLDEQIIEGDDLLEVNQTLLEKIEI